MMMLPRGLSMRSAAIYRDRMKPQQPVISIYHLLYEGVAPISRLLDSA
jgi:hypothetical protein